ncbi:tail fiber assembly protein [Candidatus Kirkpatrickella diaphorinae]|uniref:Tail fiber assembly protein n=1 Tax=Candidatus Kirkpatrickella diaphorinae TaxID=2984322 RepID=A0ABY6GH23_9PROT|nr:hypothetical protein [Candidatus Kirkpatrickella diaphorinae]UYH50807.1 tail fiber assembly protein [Candidatus Kirkpatrickella diaphorinae]
MTNDIYWSPTMKGFYPSELRPVYERNGSWPDDARPVPDHVFRAFSGAPPKPGLRRGCGADLMPIWEDDGMGLSEREARVIMAQRRLFQARETVLNQFVLMGKSVPPDWADYLRILTEISAGRDAVTALPNVPVG